ncbi:MULTISPECIES: GDSL-type esterase/lipase family protein [Actinomycetes]|uniref:GDSL-type esterase/lipase family protein n=1 Tax=Actinomycetes TaxID=1760 RepID=UPI0018CBF3AA|nr:MULTISPECIES: GDSL-type esterase/lipase family protein [Actinomycetes]
MDNGDVYFAENGTGSLKVLKKNAVEATTVLSNLGEVSWMTRDKSGVIYIPEHGRLLSWKPGQAEPTTLASGLRYTAGVAVDSKGTIYFSEFTGGTIKKITKGSSTPSTVLSGLNRPNGIAMDSQNNLFFLENGNGTLKKLAAGSTSPTQLLSDIKFGTGLAVSSTGTVYLADASAGKVRILPPGAIAAPDLVWGLANPDGLALNKSGDLFITDVVAGTLAKVVAGATPFVSGYVALGDSYSSGEGTGDYMAGTDTSVNHCHRSPHAYGPVVADAVGEPFEFHACSGSVTFDFYAPNHASPGEQGQVLNVSADTKYVTLTIGGNDVGFGPIANDCLNNSGCKKNKQLNADIQARISALKGKGTATAPDGDPQQGRPNSDIVRISKIIETIHARAPYAKIAVLGYPKIFGSSKSKYTKQTSPWPDYVCRVAGPIGIISYSYETTQWMNGIQKDLNSAISSEVKRARQQKIDVQFVDPTAAFKGHGLCDTGTPWLNAVRLLDVEESMHPTSEGQRAYAQLVAKSLFNQTLP